MRPSPTALRTLLASTLVLVAAAPAAPKYSTTLIGVRADAKDGSFLAVIRGSKHRVARCQKAHERAGGRFEGQLTVQLTFERGNATRTSTLVPTEEAADLAACTLVALVGLRVAPDWPGETADLTFDFRSDSEPVHPRSPAPWEAAEDWLDRVCTSREPVETLGPGTRRTVRCQNANDAGPIGWFLDQGRMVVKSQARVDFDHSPVASLSRVPILVPEDVERGTHVQAPGPPAACLAKVTVAVPFDTCMDEAGRRVKARRRALLQGSAQGRFWPPQRRITALVHGSQRRVGAAGYPWVPRRDPRRPRERRER